MSGIIVVEPCQPSTTWLCDTDAPDERLMMLWIQAGRLLLGRGERHTFITLVDAAWSTILEGK